MMTPVISSARFHQNTGRSVLGQLNWLQSGTQVHLCYKFSRCASAVSNPTIGDFREINKVARTLKSPYVDGRFWPLKGSQCILGMPDASHRNNRNKSSQRAHVIFLAEDRKLPAKSTYRNSVSYLQDQKLCYQSMIGILPSWLQETV